MHWALLVQESPSGARHLPVALLQRPLLQSSLESHSLLVPQEPDASQGWHSRSDDAVGAVFSYSALLHCDQGMHAPPALPSDQEPLPQVTQAPPWTPLPGEHEVQALGKGPLQDAHVTSQFRHSRSRALLGATLWYWSDAHGGRQLSQGAVPVENDSPLHWAQVLDAACSPHPVAHDVHSLVLGPLQVAHTLSHGAQPLPEAYSSALHELQPAVPPGDCWPAPQAVHVLALAL